MKVEITNFVYSAQLPNGQPTNLAISIARDGNYTESLKTYVGLLDQAKEEFKKEIERAR